MNSKQIILESLKNAQDDRVDPRFKALIERMNTSGLAHVSDPVFKTEPAEGVIFEMSDPAEFNHGYFYAEGTADNDKMYRIQRLINKDEKQWSSSVYSDFEVTASSYARDLDISIRFTDFQDSIYNIQIYGLIVS
jgi:hypothetical protein